MPLVLAAVAVGTLVATPFLTQVGTTSVVTRNSNQKMTEQYSADAGVEHALWRLRYEPGFADPVTPGSGEVNYSSAANGMDVGITVSATFVEAPPNPPPLPMEQSDRMLISKSVTPSSAPASQSTIFTYTISVTNLDTSTVHLDFLRDLLPPGFSYVPGSSDRDGNMDRREPEITLEGGQQNLEWGTRPPKPKLDAGETRTQVFQAQAVLEEGVYWNEAWTQWTPNAVAVVGTGSTAPVGAEWWPYTYHVSAAAGGTTLRSDVRVSSRSIYVLSWQVE